MEPAFIHLLIIMVLEIFVIVCEKQLGMVMYIGFGGFGCASDM